MKAEITLDNGTTVTKYIVMGDDERTNAMNFNRKMTEAWRDHLFSKYGDEWRAKDPMAGMFWKVPELK
jgi:hypothetical protein